MSPLHFHPAGIYKPARIFHFSCSARAHRFFAASIFLTLFGCSHLPVTERVDQDTDLRGRPVYLLPRTKVTVVLRVTESTFEPGRLTASAENRAITTRRFSKLRGAKCRADSSRMESRSELDGADLLVSTQPDLAERFVVSRGDLSHFNPTSTAPTSVDDEASPSVSNGSAMHQTTFSLLLEADGSSNPENQLSEILDETRRLDAEILRLGMSDVPEGDPIVDFHDATRLAELRLSGLQDAVLGKVSEKPIEERIELDLTTPEHRDMTFGWFDACKGFALEDGGEAPNSEPSDVMPMRLQIDVDRNYAAQVDLFQQMHVTKEAGHGFAYRLPLQVQLTLMAGDRLLSQKTVSVWQFGDTRYFADSMKAAQLEQSPVLIFHPLSARPFVYGPRTR